MNAEKKTKRMEKTCVTVISSSLGLWPILSWDGVLYPDLDVPIPFTIPREKLELLRKHRLIHRQGRFLYLNKPFSEEYLSTVLYCLDGYYNFTCRGVSVNYHALKGVVVDLNA